jgi:NAD-dependent deacetylase
MGDTPDLMQLMVASTDAVVFTGAGISTEAGIPDFRSPGGLWTKHMPIQFDDFCRSAEMRREAWRRKFAMESTFADARPGRGHRAVAHLVRIGRVSHVITQNIDNLHQASGVPAERVIELHGNGSYAACLGCRAAYELAWIRDAFERHGDAPDCPACGGLIKTATISFGQPMPEREMERAHDVARGCDLFVVIGSSLVVYPAAGLPVLAKRNGARLVIVNREPTDLDDFADLVIRDDIGAVLDPLSTLN